MLTKTQRKDGWRERGDIPNVNAYMVTLLLRDGTEKPAKVYKNAATGLHQLIDDNSTFVSIATVAGWKTRV